jgi:hypothetical protein
MAVSIEWDTKIINVPKADMLLIQSVPSEIRQLDLDLFRLELKSLESSVEGMSFLDTHSHNTTVTVGGVTLARVIEIINGYTITFEDGQYAVNLVGANSNVADVTNVNQVSVRSANSAGLTYSDAINKQSFQGGFVYINVDDGLAGTNFPRGTTSDPVNNYTDAKLIADINGYNNFKVEGILTIPSGVDLSRQTWEGEGVLHSDITFVDNNLTSTSFFRTAVGGVMGTGPATFNECLVKGMTNFAGAAKECLLANTVTVRSGCVRDVVFVSCYSALPGTGTPTIDINNAPCGLVVRGYAGGIKTKNISQGNDVSLDILAGHVILDATCTSGTIIIRGNSKVTDNTTGVGVTLDTSYLINSQVDRVKLDTSLIPATL